MDFKPGPHDLFVSPKGNDQWSGTIAQPSADGTDGPLATIDRARRVLRMMRSEFVVATAPTVWIRGGRYFVSRPIEFSHEDTGPAVYAAYPGETPVIDGGIVVTGWQPDTINGQMAWSADVSKILIRHGYFKSLFVNGHRRMRPRLPKKGYFHVEEMPREYKIHSDDVHENSPFDGARHFRFASGDLRQWHNLQDVQIAALHTWLEERMPIVSVDSETRIVMSTHKSVHTFRPGTRYYVENVFEALTEPGEWYLDRTTGRLHYIPFPEERIEEVEIVAAVALQLLKINGDPEHNRYVDHLTFKGLQLQNTDWVIPRGWDTRFEPGVSLEKQRPLDSSRHFQRFTANDPDTASAVQAAYNVPGVVSLHGARNCVCEEFTIRHTGFYAFDVADGCRTNAIVGCHMEDIGAGGIKIDGSDALGALCRRTGKNIISDNHIFNNGTVFPSACGIAVLCAHGNRISHNHIHDLMYSGINCGWVWGYAESVSYDNIIEYNHIHDLGKGVLSDMGGIYLLGIQPGTLVRRNLIHHVEKSEYGGWGIYCDEGTSNVVIEENIVHHVSSQPFFQHFGRENIIRNNIFAFGDEGVAALGRGGDFKWLEKSAFGDGRITNAMTFERNILITRDKPVIVGGICDITGHLESKPFISDLNLFWDVSGAQIYCGNGRHGEGESRDRMRAIFSLEQMRDMGYERHSIIADPHCRDTESGDFSLRPDSPAFALGFCGFNMETVGVRSPEQQKSL